MLIVVANYSISDIRNNNLVAPEISVNQIWIKEEDTSGVKIIELNSSSDSSKESSHNYTRTHPWSYVNNDRLEVQEDNYSRNEEARRIRRVNMEHNENFAAAYANQCYFDRGMQSTNSFFETYETEFDSEPINHQMNCFTFINNQHLKSDSSADGGNYDGVEVIELDKTDDPKLWDHVYNDEVVTSNKQTEKRTIWIYSYKNKRLLSEHDFELVNISSKDTSSCSTPCSISEEDLMADKDTTAHRIGSPIPAPYIPRLNLSLVQTLSTVTEISEANKSSKDHHDVINLPKNNWLTERNDDDKAKKIENYNVVNWMGLSPRERRRRSINTNSDINALQNMKETEITYAEGNKQFEKGARSSRSNKIESSTVQVQVDIHTNIIGTKKKSLASPKNETKPDKNKIADIIPMKISFADADNDIVANHAKLDYSKRRSIKISSKYNKADITDPIEKLDCDNWITEEVEKEKNVYDYDLENGEDMNVTVSSSEAVVINSASRRLWMRNLQLMKAPQWSEYLPITCSPPSLHLSLSLNSLDGKQSWFKRFTKCIKCCK